MDVESLKNTLDEMIRKQVGLCKDEGFGAGGQTATYAQLVSARVLLELLELAKKQNI